MSFVQLVPARLIHVGPIAVRMRRADVEEVTAMGHSPKQALRTGMRVSIHCYTAMIDGRPEAMMGLAPTNILEGEGSPWMLGTDVVYHNGRAMLALGPKVFAIWRDSLSGELSNVVGRTNACAIRMLRRWGYSIDDEPVPINGLDFVKFRMEA